jgi:hypothetical protein
VFTNERYFKNQERLEYLTIPLNLKYYIDNQKEFYINGGPFVGFFLGNNSVIYPDNTSNAGKNPYKILDFGANLGVGKRFPINDKYSLNIELRHNCGLVNIQNIDVLAENTVKTNSFNLIANWQFD